MFTPHTGASHTHTHKSTQSNAFVCGCVRVHSPLGYNNAGQLNWRHVKTESAERGVACAISSCEMKYYSITIAISVETSSFYDDDWQLPAVFFLLPLLFSLSLSGRKTGIFNAHKDNAIAVLSDPACVCVKAHARVLVQKIVHVFSLLVSLWRPRGSPHHII